MTALDQTIALQGPCGTGAVHIWVPACPTELVRGLKAGHLKAVVLQDPVQMGYDAVRIMAQKLRGKGDIPAKIEVPEALATTENLNDPKIDKLLHPLKAEK